MVYPEFFERGACSLATDLDEQIRVPHVLKNMGHPAQLTRLGCDGHII